MIASCGVIFNVFTSVWGARFLCRVRAYVSHLYFPEFVSMISVHAGHCGLYHIQWLVFSNRPNGMLAEYAKY
jgi:hypothetical protein